MGEERKKVYRVLVGKPEGKRLLKIPRGLNGRMGSDLWVGRHGVSLLVATNVVTHVWKTFL
jgi:hypothetical protein